MCCLLSQFYLNGKWFSPGDEERYEEIRMKTMLKIMKRYGRDRGRYGGIRRDKER